VFTEKDIADQCKKYNRMAQTMLYKKYAYVFYGICLRYAGSKEEAEDILHEALIKIMTRIKTFTWRGEGSFFSWSKKIVINTAISHINKNNKIHLDKYRDDIDYRYENEEDTFGNTVDKKDIDDSKIDYSIVKNAKLSQEEMIEALTELPEYFRVVFNLHVIEGIKHKQIAKMLSISEKTSKTRLFRARMHLQKIIYKKSIEKVGI
jgi:RNA polymerase sigma-70 factor (ECF subfamily)